MANNVDFTRFYKEKFDFDNEELVRIQDIRVGDVVHFYYKKKHRLVLVLNPKYEDKMHCLTLEYIRPIFFENVERNVATLDTEALYNRYKNSINLQNTDSYRTFNIPDIQNPKLLTKKNQAAFDSDAIFIFKNAILLGTVDNKVLIERYPDMIPRVMLVSSYFGSYHPNETPPSFVADFVHRQLKANKFLRSWEPSETPAIDADNHQARIRSITAIARRDGGVFFLKSEDIDLVKDQLNRSLLSDTD